VLSGLFTLAGFDVSNQMAVIAPFSSGCGLFQNPYLEKIPVIQEDNRMFDVRRVLCFADELTFAAPMNKFERMIENMEESFLITGSGRSCRREYPDGAGVFVSLPMVGF